MTSGLSPEGTPKRQHHRPADVVKATTQRVLRNRQVNFVRAVISRFFEISGTRQAMVVAFNMFIGFVPLMIIIFALRSRRNPSVTIGRRIVELVGLHGQTAEIVSRAFPPSSRVLVAASLISVGSLLLTGLDVSGGISESFNRAWHVEPRKGWTSPVRSLAWFLLMLLQFIVILLLTRSSGHSVVLKRLLGIPLLLLFNFRFWIATPRLLLNQPLARKDLRLGALVGVGGTLVIGAISQWLLPGWFDSYTQGFGAMGVALALTSWLYVIGIVWVLTIVIGAVLWERNAPVEDVVEFELAAGSDETSEPNG